MSAIKLWSDKELQEIPRWLSLGKTHKGKFIITLGKASKNTCNEGSHEVE